MDYFKDAIGVSKEAFIKMLSSLKYLPMIILGHIFISFTLNILSNILGGLNLGLIGSFIYPFIRASAFSLYLYILNNGIEGYTILRSEIKRGMGEFFVDVYVAFFVIFVIELLLKGFNIPYLNYIILLVFSALPETLYIGNRHGIENIYESLEFLKSNWYIWLPYSIIFGLVLIMTNIGLTLIPQVYIPIFIPSYYVHLAAYFILFNIFALFRGQLFKILYLSNIRKRKFMGMY